MMLYEGEYLNAKDLLLQYRDIMEYESEAAKKLKSKKAYFKYVEDHRKEFSRLANLRETILHLLEHNMDLFTVDEDTYQLTQEFLDENISSADALIDQTRNELTEDELNYYEEIKEEVLRTGRAYDGIIEVSPLEALNEIKETYIRYREELDEHIPKC